MNFWVERGVDSEFPHMENKKKTKKPSTQQAAHGIPWSALFRSKAFWRTLISSIVIGKQNGIGNPVHAWCLTVTEGS